MFAINQEATACYSAWPNMVTKENVPWPRHKFHTVYKPQQAALTFLAAREQEKKTIMCGKNSMCIYVNLSKASVGL